MKERGPEQLDSLSAEQQENQEKLEVFLEEIRPTIMDFIFDKLNEILLKSYKEYPREYLFIKKDIYLQMKPIKTNSLSTRLKEIFSKDNNSISPTCLG